MNSYLTVIMTGVWSELEIRNRKLYTAEVLFRWAELCGEVKPQWLWRVCETGAELWQPKILTYNAVRKTENKNIDTYIHGTNTPSNYQTKRHNSKDAVNFTVKTSGRGKSETMRGKRRPSSKKPRCFVNSLYNLEFQWKFHKVLTFQCFFSIVL